LGDSDDEKIKLISARGIEVHSVEERRGPAAPQKGVARMARAAGVLGRSLFRQSDAEDVFPGARHSPAVAALIQPIHPYATVPYHWDAASTAVNLPYPTLSLVGDPADLPIRERRAFEDRYGQPRGLRQQILDFLYCRNVASGMIHVLKSSAGCGAFAAHHA